VAIIDGGREAVMSLRSISGYGTGMHSGITDAGGAV